MGILYIVRNDWGLIVSCGKTESATWLQPAEIHSRLVCCLKGDRQHLLYVWSTLTQTSTMATPVNIINSAQSNTCMGTFRDLYSKQNSASTHFPKVDQAHLVECPSLIRNKMNKSIEIFHRSEWANSCYTVLYLVGANCLDA